MRIESSFRKYNVLNFKQVSSRIAKRGEIGTKARSLCTKPHPPSSKDSFVEKQPLSEENLCNVAVSGKAGPASIPIGDLERWSK